MPTDSPTGEHWQIVYAEIKGGTLTLTPFERDGHHGLSWTAEGYSPDDVKDMPEITVVWKRNESED